MIFEVENTSRKIVPEKLKSNQKIQKSYCKLGCVKGVVLEPQKWSYKELNWVRRAVYEGRLR